MFIPLDGEYVVIVFYEEGVVIIVYRIVLCINKVDCKFSYFVLESTLSDTKCSIFKVVLSYSEVGFGVVNTFVEGVIFKHRLFASYNECITCCVCNIAQVNEASFANRLTGFYHYSLRYIVSNRGHHGRELTSVCICLNENLSCIFTTTTPRTATY